MFFYPYRRPNGFDATRFSKFPSHLEEDDEGIWIAKSTSVAAAKLFTAVVQHPYQPPVDPIAAHIGLTEDGGPVVRRTPVLVAIPNDLELVLVCSSRPATRLANQVVAQLESIERPTLSLPAFLPDSDVITAVCEKLNGFGMNLERGEWVYRGKRGRRELVRVAGQSFLDILSNSEVYELLGLSDRPMVFGQMRVNFPGVASEALWVLWRTHRQLGYRISLYPPGAPLANFIEVGVKAARVLLDTDISGMVSQAVLESFFEVAGEA